MRRILKRFLPDHDAVRDNRWLRPFTATLLHPRLWHLNRRSAAGAVAVGLFCGLIPGPFQMMGAAIGCVLLRVNLPLALITTLYTNPLTIVPLYMAAYELGRLALGRAGDGFVAPPELGGLRLLEWVDRLSAWMLTLGEPLAIGLVLLALALALSGYLAVHAVWRAWLLRAWHRRRARHRPASR